MDLIANPVAVPTLPETSLDSLSKHGHLHGGTVAQHPSTHEAFNEILRDPTRTLFATEPQSTTFLTMFDGPLEKAVIEVLCRRAGVVYTADLRLLSGKDFRWDSAAKDRRTIDFVVARWVGEGAPQKGSQGWELVIAVEAKYGAAVNGGHGYCKKHPRRYSNQIICYLHGCVDGRLSRRKGVAFLWLGYAPKSPEAAPWERKAIHEGDFKWAGLEKAFRRQERARKHWQGVTWAELGQAITAALESEGLSSEAEAIVRFLRAG